MLPLLEISSNCVLVSFSCFSLVSGERGELLGLVDTGSEERSGSSLIVLVGSPCATTFTDEGRG